MPSLVVESELLPWPKTLDVSGPGGTMRFGIGTPAGRRSSVWRIEVSKTKQDIYVGQRDLMGQLKISLHASGDWRFAHTGKNGDRLVEAGESRIIDQWPRPAQRGGGWTWALDIWIPASSLTDSGTPGLTKPVKRSIHWLREVAGRDLYGFHVVVAKGDQGTVGLNNLAPVDICYMAPREDGEIEFCLLLVSATSLTPDQRDWLEEQRAFLASRLQSEDAPAMQNPKGIIFGNVGEARTFWELAVPKPR